MAVEHLVVEAPSTANENAIELFLSVNVASEDFSPIATAHADINTPSDPWLNDELLELVFG